MGIIVNFVCDFPGEFALAIDPLSFPKILDSPLFYGVYASTRLRCLIPLNAVGRAFSARLISYRTLLSASGRFGPDDRFVLFKPGSRSLKENADLARAVVGFAGTCPSRVIYDTCDPAHADSDRTVSGFQTELLRQAAFVTCATDELAKDLRSLTDTPIRVIADTIDCLPAAERFAPGEVVRIVWFGWMTKPRFTVLVNHLAAIQGAASDRRFECAALCQDYPPEWFSDANRFLTENGGGKTRLSHRRWVLPEAWDIIADHDIALIPHDLDGDGTARFKSHNRLTTAIRRGVFAVASPIPAYRPLSDYCWLGDNLAEGVAWALAHPDEARARIAAGQARIDALYGPEAVGARWIEVLTEAAARA